MIKCTDAFSFIAILFALFSLFATSQDVPDPEFNNPIQSKQLCSPAESRLDPITHKFRSACGLRQWCKPTVALNHDSLLDLPIGISVSPQRRDISASLTTVAMPTAQSLLKLSGPTTSSATPKSLDFGLCVDKGCRRDEYPFGYRGIPFDDLPPQCGPGQYCPDDESSCQPLLALGQPCQLNRDDSCKHDGIVPFQVLCLQGQCRLAMGSQNDSCILDRTEYLGYNESGSAIISTISRDDCQLGFYCQDSTTLCQSEKANDFDCLEDRECINFNCNKITFSCQDSPIHLHQVPLWAWIVVVFIILLALFSLVFGLYKVHLNHRVIRSEEIDQFFSQQWLYRHSILSMQAAAATASLHRNSQSSFHSSTAVNDDATKGKEHQRDSAWTSGLQVKTFSPTANYSTATLSPRLCHRQSSSP